MLKQLTPARTVAVALLFLIGLVATLTAAAEEPANPAFQRTWGYTDQPVAAGAAHRTWLWGPEAFTGALSEPYVESPGGERTVQYYDKSRMEITRPDADPESDWYVTNGLLVLEMMSGQIQLGNDLRETRQPAEVNLVGDIDDPNAPTYATLAKIIDEPAAANDATITQRLSRDGTITDDPDLANLDVLVANRVQVPGIDHQIAAPFWELMNSTGTVWQDGEFVIGPLFSNPYYATGFPITEPYWTRVRVGGVEKDVLMQAFERRVLTYTPDNPSGWQVEAGNVGRHYYDWRYGTTPPDENGEPEPTPSATPPEPTPMPTPSATPTPAAPPVSSDSYAVANSIGGYGSEDGQLISPQGVGLGEDGLVFIADTGNDRIVAYDDGGDDYLLDWGTHGNGPGQFDTPTGVAVNSEGLIYVVDSGNDRIQVFELVNGVIDYRFEWGDSGSDAGEFDAPTAIAIDIIDDVYVVDTGNDRIQRFNAEGGIVAEWGDRGSGDFEFRRPTGIGVDRASNVYVADTGNNRIVEYTSDGFTLVTEWGSFGDGPMEFKSPSGVAIDTVGNVAVADSGNERISIFTHDGQSLLDQWGGSDAFSNPTALAINDAQGLYVTDTGNHRVIHYEAR